MDLLLQKHRAEVKNLQGEIQQIKKLVPKGDRKRLKESQLTISALEEQLRSNQKQEIDEFNLNVPMETLSVETDVPKPHKSKKKKKKDNGKLDTIIRNYNENDESSERIIEMKDIINQLKNLNMKLVEIPADGNCLFNAVAYQCIKKKLLSFPTEFTKNDEAAVYLRNMVFEEMTTNQDNYTAFFLSEENDYDAHCEEIRSTRSWGGHLELKALSHKLAVTIVIIQARLEPIVIDNSDCHGDPASHSNNVTICYHKYALGLGEHYNSCDYLLPQESSVV